MLFSFVIFTNEPGRVFSSSQRGFRWWCRPRRAQRYRLLEPAPGPSRLRGLTRRPSWPSNTVSFHGKLRFLDRLSEFRLFCCDILVSGRQNPRKKLATTHANATWKSYTQNLKKEPLVYLEPSLPCQAATVDCSGRSGFIFNNITKSRFENK